MKINLTIFYELWHSSSSYAGDTIAQHYCAGVNGQFAAGGKEGEDDGDEEEHLFIDEILNVWQHIQNGEHMMEWDDEQAQSSSSNIQVAKIHKNLSDFKWMIWEAFGLPYHPFVHLSHVNCNFRTIPLSFSFATMIPPDLKSFGPSSFAEPTK